MTAPEPPRAVEWPYAHAERVGPGRTLLLEMRGPWLFEGEERFESLGGVAQRVQIGDFTEFGRGLVLDGQVQLAEGVDALYTTALVFPAALVAPSRRRWLIVGGGDGAAAREALRFRDTESVRLVDISAMVIAQTQALIPSFWAGCQHDPRLHVTTTDAWEVLRGGLGPDERADIIIFDLTDPENADYTPYPETSADHLYSDAAFELAARALAPDGVFVAQVQELSLLRHRDHLRRVASLRRFFRHVVSYRVYVEFFGYWESFVLATNHAAPWSPLPTRPVGEILSSAYAGDWGQVWSPRWHEQLFALPPSLEARLRP